MNTDRLMEVRQALNGQKMGLDANTWIAIIGLSVILLGSIVGVMLWVFPTKLDAYKAHTRIEKKHVADLNARDREIIDKLDKIEANTRRRR